MEFHNNDVSQDARPSIWIFQGKTVVLLVASVAAGCVIFQTVSAIGVELVPAAAMGLMPLGIAALGVATLVNGKPPSYALDTFRWQWFRFMTWLYRIGALDTPPQLWMPQKPVPHPTMFGRQER